MDRSDRAKQFMPFQAVTGLEAALRQKEREVESDYGIINRNVRYEPFNDEISGDVSPDQEPSDHEPHTEEE